MVFASQTGRLGDMSASSHRAVDSADSLLLYGFVSGLRPREPVLNVVFRHNGTMYCVFCSVRCIDASVPLMILRDHACAGVLPGF